MAKGSTQQFDKYKQHSKEEHHRRWDTMTEKKVPQINYVEFGKAFDIAVVIISDPIAVKAAYQMALDSFFQAKADNFPTWDGLPEIKVNTSSSYGNALQGGKQIGWYAQVPKKYVLTEEDKIKKLDEELWDL